MKKDRHTSPASFPFWGCLLGLCGVLLFVQVKAQARHFLHFGSRDGLSDSRVQCLLRDRAGYLWVGTAHGLNRFDGHGFRPYLPQAHGPALSNAGINALAQDAQGRLWIATDDGLNALDTRDGQIATWRNTGRDDGSLPNSLVRHLLVDTQDRVWLACDNRDLARFDPASGRFVRLPFRRFVVAALPGLSPDDYISIERLQAKGKEGLWLFSNRGLFSLDFTSNRFRYHPRTSPGAGPACTQTFAAWNADLLLLDTCTQQVVFQPLSEAGSLVSHENNSHAVTHFGAQHWLIAQGQLWWQAAGQPWQILAKENLDAELGPTAPLHSLIADDDGTVWIGGTEGLWRCAPAEQHFSVNDLPGQQFTHFVELRAQGRWLALDGPGARLLVLRGSEVEKTLLLSGEGRLLTRDGSGQIWLGAGARLYRFDSIQLALREFPLPASTAPAFAQGDFVALAQDKAGRLWWGHDHAGLLVWDAAKDIWWRPGEAEGFISQSVTSLLADPVSGEVWIGTDDFGLFRYLPVPGRFQLYQHDAQHPAGSLGAFMVEGLCRDGGGRLWVATDPGGLSRFDPQAAPGAEFLTLGVAQGLPSGRCFGICPDQKGDLWVLTNGGLAWIDHRSLRVRSFNGEDGLPEGLSMLPHRLADGRIRLGRTGGFCEFQPDALLRQRVDPRMLVGGFRIFDRECADSLGLQAGRPITLSYQQNFFSLEFASADLALAHKLTYAYRLRGFDADWINSGKSRVASYTNVPPGSYTLEVRSALEGSWNAVGLAIPILIRPPYWQTWWFRVLAVVLVGGLAVLLYRWRIRGVRREAALRHAFTQQIARTEMAALRAQMNPHFVFNCLSSINRYILVNQPDEASAYLTKFARLIRLILDNSRTETVLLRKELDAIGLYVEMEQMRFNHRFAYRLDIAPEVQPEHMEVPPLLIQPFVENAIWHGLMHKKGAGLLQLRLFLEGQRLCVVIEDDGVGRRKAAELKSRSATVNKSHGMQLSSERIAAINRLYGTQAHVSTEDLLDAAGEAAGTRITLRF